MKRHSHSLRSICCTPRSLAKPNKGRPLLYLSVMVEAVPYALIHEEGKMQKPVYFINRALRGVEVKYPRVKMLAFALVVVAH